MTSRLPTIIITGASGLIGRSLLEDLKGEFRIFAIARRSQRDCGAPIHPNIAWLRADIAEPQIIGRAFSEISTAGGADYLFHLAAYYDFTGKDHPEYRRTNVAGTKQILTLAQGLKLKLLVFASSVAACAFPEEGASLDETSPPAADHIYGWSKREGEKQVQSGENTVRSCIVRFGAVFTDWCEYPPLYMFLNTWLGRSWKAGILAGKGESAIPYIHIRDIVAFFRQLMRRQERLSQGQVVIASTAGSTAHRRLFELATQYYYGASRRPVLMPRFLTGWGLYAMNAAAHLVRRPPPFEQPWMRRFIDLKLRVQNRRTCELLEWSPISRHHVERRIPYLVERLRSEPYAWHACNLKTMRRNPERPELQMHIVLSPLEERVCTLVVDQLEASDTGEHFDRTESGRAELFWFARLLYRLLLTSLYTGNRMLILNYFEVSAPGRFEAGFSASGMTSLLKLLSRTVLRELDKVEKLKPFGQEKHDCVAIPIEFGIDEVEQQYETYLQKKSIQAEPKQKAQAGFASARDQLEDTIWRCLVLRK